MPQFKSFRDLKRISLSVALCISVIPISTAQESAKPPAAPQPPPAGEEKQPELPAQIELLETRVRFETNGDSRKEVHAHVRINNELGVSQFARLNFDYNRSFQQVELPLMRITHAGGGTADILPGAISDQPNPAVVNFPAYQDVRVKSVRILGLGPGDLLEYRVVTTTTHHPLAPDFWFDHTFDRSGVVSHEIFELDLPSSRANDARSIESSPPEKLDEILYKPGLARVYVSPPTPPAKTETTGEGDSACFVYRWDLTARMLSLPSDDTSSESNGSDIVVSTFASWRNLASHIGAAVPLMLVKDFYALKPTFAGRDDMEGVYAFVSQKIRTVDLPIGATGFHFRDPREVLSSGYGTPEDKVLLFRSLVRPTYVSCWTLFVGPTKSARNELPDPSQLKHILIEVPGERGGTYYLDPSVEVAPYGVIPSDLRGKGAFRLQENLSTDEERWWTKIPNTLPFPSLQRVNVDASLAVDGTLSAKVHYAMRGDNELLLRLAFHQAPKEKWKDIAQLLALSDGFRGKVTNVTASDPYATKEPFTVEYEITQPGFVDWSKKPVRIPALLPLLALPELPGKSAADSTPPSIQLGTPLDVQTRVTLHVPPDTSIQAPVGTSVERDYATFASEYSARRLTLTGERHINFLQREIPAERAADYAYFVHAVQNDQAQQFTLERANPSVDSPAKTKAAQAASSKP